MLTSAHRHIEEQPEFLDIGPLPVPAEEVHCWFADLDVPREQFVHLRGSLSPDELERSRRFKFEPHRRRFIAARGILRDILGRYLGAEPSGIEFRYDSFGKPELGPGLDDALRFNVSHAGGRALIAIATHARVGVDLEPVQPRADHADIARHYFPAREAEQLGALPSDHYTEAFLGCWTKREAYLKACGCGLQMPMSTVTVPLATDPAFDPVELCMASYDLVPHAHWTFYTLRPAPGWIGALVIEGAGRRLRERRWEATGA